MFTHLQLHTHYSLLEGIGSPKNYIAKAQELGLKTLPMTDYNGLYGAIEFYQAAQAAEIKPILGVELFCVHDAKNPADTAGGYIVLLAENIDGYQALLELVSFANMDGFAGKPRIDFTTLNKYGTDLICLVGGERSILGQLIIQNESVQKQAEIIALLQNACGEDAVYCMLMTHSEAKHPTIGRINTVIKDLAKQTSCQITLSQDVHYINPDDQQPFEIALSIKDGKRVYDEDRRTVSLPLHLTSEEEIRTTMEKNGYDAGDIQKYIENNQDVADRCNCKLALNQLLFPKYQAPDHIQKLYETHKNELVV